MKISYILVVVFAMFSLQGCGNSESSTNTTQSIQTNDITVIGFNETAPPRKNEADVTYKLYMDQDMLLDLCNIEQGSYHYVSIQDLNGTERIGMHAQSSGFNCATDNVAPVMIPQGEYYLSINHDDVSDPHDLLGIAFIETNRPDGKMLHKAIPTPVNGQITDAVTQTNVKVLGDAPAMSMGELYTTTSQALGQAFTNAKNSSPQTTTTQAATTQGIMAVYSLHAAPVPASTAAPVWDVVYWTNSTRDGVTNDDARCFENSVNIIIFFHH
jgi:hypothetical protein